MLLRYTLLLAFLGALASCRPLPTSTEAVTPFVPSRHDDAALAIPLDGSLGPELVVNCPGEVGRCEVFEFVPTVSGDVSVEVTTQQAVQFAALRTVREASGRWSQLVDVQVIDADASKTTTRIVYRWSAKAGSTYLMKLQVFAKPTAGDVSYSLKLAGLRAVRKQPTREAANVDWDAEHERIMKLEPRQDMAQPRLPEGVVFSKAEWKKRGASRLQAEGSFRYDILSEKGECYYITASLNGRWSPEARRHLHAMVVYPDGTLSTNSVWSWYYRAGAQFGAICAPQSGMLHLVVRTHRRALAPWAGEVATGTWNVELWARSSNRFKRDRQALLASVAKTTAGLTKQRTLAAGDLKDITSIDLPVKAGSCYAAVLMLGQGAAWSKDVVDAGNANFKLDTAGLGVSGGPGVTGPGAVGSLGCFLASRPGTLRVQIPKAKSLGTGPYTLDLYQGPMPATELAERKRELRARGQVVADVVSEAQMDGCSYCRKRRALCADEGAAGCDKEFLTCLAQATVTSAQCR